MELLDLMKQRRSVRTYTGEAISEEKLQMVLKAGLLSPTGKNLKSYEFVVVRDKDMLAELSKCRPAGSAMIANAAAVIVVLGDTACSDVWTEDCSIAMTQMLLMAEAQGLGGVWVQGRLRPSPDGGTADEVVRGLLGVPEQYQLEAMLSLGVPFNHPSAHTEDELANEKVHWDKF